MGIFLALLIVSISLLILLLKYRHSYWLRRHVPHNAPSFPMGDFKGWRKTKSSLEILQPVYRKFKGKAPFAGIFMVFRPVALIMDIELVKNILIKDFNNFRDRGFFHNERDDPLTGHLANLEGPRWRELRQKITPTFTSGKMKYMFPTVTNVAHEFVQVMLEKQAAAPGGVLEMSDLSARYTADVIGSCAFGLDCNSLRNPNADFVTMGQKAVIARRHTKVVDTLMEAAPRLARALRMRRIPQDVHDFYMGIVNDTINFREKNNVERKDLIQLLIELKNKDPKDGGITLNELAAQSFAFFLAGYDTSANTMGFTLYELAKNPDLQERLRSEIGDVLERHNNEFTYEAMQDMTYLQQVVSETLRKYPVVSHLQRVTITDYKTDDPNYTIEKDTMVFIPVYEIHHDPKYYPNPDRFDPDRFTEEEIKKRPACTSLGFGEGPRNCIGLRFGKMEVLIGLTNVLTNFRFSVCEETGKELIFRKDKIILQSANGIKLRVERLRR